MNLNQVQRVRRPKTADDIGDWGAGCAWLAGGTWLFSEPQPAIDTLIDLECLGWPALRRSADGCDIAATCTIAELCRFPAPADWIAAPLFRGCADALLASFKVCNVATVGGNICMSLPAGAMIALTVALEARYTLWPRSAPPREVAALDFVTGDHANILQPGELLRSIHLPAAALQKRFALRRMSLTRLGRSAALVIGTQDDEKRDLLLTITAATRRPVQLRFDRLPSASALREAVEDRIAAQDYFADAHGSAAYKRHLTRQFTEQVRAELAGEAGR